MSIQTAGPRTGCSENHWSYNYLSPSVPTVPSMLTINPHEPDEQILIHKFKKKIYFYGLLLSNRPFPKSEVMPEEKHDADVKNPIKYQKNKIKAEPV